MTPHSFSSSFSFSRSSSSQPVPFGSIDPFNSLHQPVPPTPDLLQTGSMPSSFTFDRNRLQPSDFSTLMSQPHLGPWVTHITIPSADFSLTASSSSSSSSSSSGSSNLSSSSSSSISSSSGSSGRLSITRPIRKTRKRDISRENSHQATVRKPDPKRVRITSELSGPIPTSRQTAPLAEALQCISGSTLMQTRQQLRDQEFNRSIALHLTPVPASIIRNYVGSELSLSPLERNESGTPQTTPSNTLILNSIFNEFGQDYPGSTLFKNEITETHHRKTLDPLFTEKETRWESRNLLKELILNNPEALQQRKQDLRSVVHYWSFSECEKQLTDEMAGSKRTDFNGDEVIKLRTVTVDLLIDALKQRRHSPETELIRERELEYSRAQSILIQAHTRLTIDPESACDLILKALQIFCNLNKKREAVGLVILLIEQSVRFPRTDFDHIMQLFSAAKALCLCYPTSDDLYAKLLFAIDGSCYQRSQFTQLKKIYDEAHTNPLKLKYSYNAKFTFRHIMADHHAGESTLTSMMRVNCALDNFLPRLVGGRDFPSFIDLSRGEFMRSVAKLFRLAAVITDLHARRITQWNEQQLAEILSLIKHENPKQLREPYKPCANYAGLNFRPALSNASSQARLLSASAEYYKTALKILLEFEEDREPETPRLIVSLFDNLVQLYQKNRNVEDLELLLHKTTLAKFNKMQIFKSNISGWRKVLRQLKKEASEA